MYSYWFSRVAVDSALTEHLIVVFVVIHVINVIDLIQNREILSDVEHVTGQIWIQSGALLPDDVIHKTEYTFRRGGCRRDDQIFFRKIKYIST